MAANMPPHTYTTGSGIFRFAWRARQNSTTILASQKATSRKASTSSLRTSTTQRKSMADKTRDVRSALPTQGLRCQWATCTPQVVCARDGHARVPERALEPHQIYFSHQRAALSLEAVQAWHDGQQGMKSPPRPGSATRLHALAARQWGQPQLPAPGQDLQLECVGGRSVVPDSWWLSACAPWPEDQGVAPSKRQGGVG